MNNEFTLICESEGLTIAESAAGSPLYLRRDGRRIRDRDEAMASWSV